MKTLENRVAVITGAGGGLGRALAAEITGRGGHVALVDVAPEALEATARSVERNAVKVSQHVADVTSAERMAALVPEVVSAHGGVDLLVNNAGITLQKSFATHSLDDWKRIVGINFWGVVHGCHFFLDELRRSEDAHVVNLSSMSAFAGLPTQSSYSATKAAVQALSESLWAELAVEGIGVTSVHPGAIRTDMIQATLADSDDVEAAKRNYAMAQKMGVAPEYAARRILDAVLKGRLRVRIGREAVLLDWLKRLMPAAIHRPMIRIARSAAPRPGGSGAA